MAITRKETRWNPETGSYDDAGTITTHEGRVLKVYNRDHRAMSDVYTFATFALVVEDDGSIRELMVNANFECDTSGGRATVDATPECLAVLKAHDEAIANERACREEAARQARIEEERNRPVRGKRMVVYRGRKVPVGTVGTVAHIWEGDRVLLKADNEWQDRNAPGTWVSARNLRAI